jgi:hypothetical protein
VVIKIILVLLNFVAMCGYQGVDVDVLLNKGNSAEIYNFVLVLESVKVGVALPGRVDTWGVTVGIRAGFRSLV